MMSLSKAQILSFIHESEALLTTEAAAPPHDYQSLKIMVLQRELKEEISALKAMVENPRFAEEFETQFKERCAERHIRNRGTALSFTEMPEGVTNTLYGKIAMLFELPTMSALCCLLLPEVMEQVVPDYKLDTSIPFAHVGMRGVSVSFTKKPLSTLEETPSLERLGDFIVAGRYLLDAKGVQDLRLPLHRIYYQTLTESYPELASALYSRNAELRKLKDTLVLLEGGGKTPFEAISALIRELRIGGSRMTGAEDAAPNTLRACAAFRAYLDAIPPDTRDRLMNLPIGSSDKSFKTIIDHLNAGYCVEVAARYLQVFLDMSGDKGFLNTSPVLSKDYMMAISKEYRTSLACKADGHLMHLPSGYLKEAIKKINIRNASDFIRLLLSFPPILYISLLESVVISLEPKLPGALIERIKEGVLNEEQKKAFFTALYNNRERIGLGYLIFFYSHLGLMEEIMSQLRELSPEKVIKLLIDDLFRLCIDQPELLKTILKLLPRGLPLTTLMQSNATSGNTLLHFVVARPELLEIVLNLYPQDVLSIAVRKQNTHIAVLLAAARHSKCVQMILKVLPTDGLLALVMEKDIFFGETLLSHVSADTVRLILELLPIEQRLTAMLARDKEGTPFFHGSRALGFSPLEAAELKNGLNLLLPRDRSTVLVQVDKKGFSIFHRVAARGAHGELVALLELLPPAERLDALMVKNKEGFRVLDGIFMDGGLDKIRRILELLPPEKRLLALKERNTYSVKGETFLHYFFIDNSKIELLQMVLNLLPMEQRWPALMEGNQRSKLNNLEEILHKRPHAFKVVLTALPSEQWLAALKARLIFIMKNRLTLTEGEWRELACVLHERPIGERRSILTEVKKDATLPLYRKFLIQQMLIVEVEAFQQQLKSVIDKIGQPGLFAKEDGRTTKKALLLLQETMKVSTVKLQEKLPLCAEMVAYQKGCEEAFQSCQLTLKNHRGNSFYEKYIASWGRWLLSCINRACFEAYGLDQEVKSIQAQLSCSMSQVKLAEEDENFLRLEG